EVVVDGEAAGRVRADGVIVSSPTGSTAYSLSSFGPIVDPGLDALVLTAIAPFRAEARALVLEPLRTICLRAVDRDTGSVVLVDGAAEQPMPAGATLAIYRSPRRARIVRFGASFFYRLRGKGILPWAEAGPTGGAARAGVPPAT
ncbi:ATP-NAD/AcoX kinase, partial [mine drainage metagenome]